MKRRNFIKTSTLSAFAISAYGFIHFDGEQYIGDCETTSDILGPYYRPNSPVRSNLRITGDTHELVELSGYIRHNDCLTPYKNAKVELWHCDRNGIYDNQSPEFRYRGTVFTDEKGFYSFQTVFPVAYAGEGFIRPAHFHMMITAESYQPLITQLYFKGDKHIDDDLYASSPNAKKRILEVKKMSTGTTKVEYSVGMSEVLNLEVASIDKLLGKYTQVNDKEKVIELFKFQNRLWMKNEAFGNKFEYIGNNIFEEANNPDGMYWRLEFKILATGTINFTESYIDTDLSDKVFTYIKDK
ncbi:dioxygenase family protein [Mangrovibacterium lignilyticum]|uniref:dioxygenase family protein n=1 Tax=Mangrovibacterium lignilyticum TaxID=2668052 RepID=UPI0013D46CB8|nr:catechol 1,2-dioxygenase [Mangrovibacterium lignilyticum]